MDWTFHFTVPVMWNEAEHPLGATARDWFDVTVPGVEDRHMADTAARLFVRQQFGPDSFYTTYVDGLEWIGTERWRPGRCVAPTFPRTEQVDAAIEAWFDEHDDEIREQIHTGERDRRGRLIRMEDDQ